MQFPNAPKRNARVGSKTGLRRQRFRNRASEEGRSLLPGAIADGTLRSTIDIELALDMVHGSIFYRLPFQHQPLDRRFAEALVEQAAEGLGT